MPKKYVTKIPKGGNKPTKPKPGKKYPPRQPPQPTKPRKPHKLPPVVGIPSPVPRKHPPRGKKR